MAAAVACPAVPSALGLASVGGGWVERLTLGPDGLDGADGVGGKVNGVQVVSPDGGQVLAEGRNGGVGNGGREHFRFSQPGGGFPPGCLVRILVKDGSTQEVRVDNPGMRREGTGGGK